MGTLLRLLQRYRHILLFVFLESLSLYLYFDSTQLVKAQLGSMSHRVQGRVFSAFRAVEGYLSLREENEALVRENIALRDALERAGRSLRGGWGGGGDDTLQYRRLSARVVHNTLSGQHNLFMLDRGSADSVSLNMPVLSHGNVSGIVIATTSHYSKAISLINTDLRVSAKLSRTNYFGSLHWDGADAGYGILTEIPHHVEMRPGDSVVTSGFSNIFPPGLPLGVVVSVESRSGDFSTARVRYAADFRRLQHVVVLENRYGRELDSLRGVEVEGYAE